MLKSMTGFGRSEFVNDDYELTFEIKSVNHKFLDIQVKLPYFLNFCEEGIKNIIRKKLSRGRVDVFVRGKQKFSSGASSVEINHDLAKAYFEAYRSIAKNLDMDCDISIGHILKNDNVVEIKTDNIDEEILKQNVISSLDVALDELVNMRCVEGENLKEDLSNNIFLIENNLEKIKASSKDILNNQMERLKSKLQEFSCELSETEINRLNLEFIFYTDKLDINEEIARLTSHIKNFREFLNSDTQIGKKMEFLLQEMNREVNTIASKSNNFLISTHVIEMKVCIEKLREQIQNIE